MALTPYSPIHGPEKMVTQEDMWRVLEKHGGTRPEAVQTPKAEPAVALQPLVWLTPVKTGDGSGYVLTQCGRFSIEKRKVKGKSMYMAWLRKEPPHESISLGIRLTRREAEHLCELEAGK